MLDLFKPDVLDSDEKLFRAGGRALWQTFAALVIFVAYLLGKWLITGEPGVLGVESVRFAFIVTMLCTGSLAYACSWEARQMAKKTDQPG